MDSVLTAKSVQQLTVYLQKKGYYNAYVTDSIHLRKQKAVVVYQLHPGEPYKIRSISYSTKDDGMDTILARLKNSSLIIAGQNPDEDILDKERERLTADIRDNGYYFFNKTLKYAPLGFSSMDDISFLMPAIAFAGLSPFGQVFVQFIIV